MSSGAGSTVAISETEVARGRSKEDKPSRTDPGACRHGNFINYYQFHPAEERLRQLPRDLWHAAKESSDRKYVGIDVGCNAGDLTLALYDFLSVNLIDTEVSLIGVDLDPILIERAREGEERNSGSNGVVRDVVYECVDFMSDESRGLVLDEYLNKKEREYFDVAFCFSITMWIHINHGDVGLVKFLKSICDRSKLIVIEPQPWKCYRNACRRLRRANVEEIPDIEGLEYKGDPEKHIENILTSPVCGFEKITESDNNGWGRKLLIYRRGRRGKELNE